MSARLRINSEEWNLWGSDGMKLFLPRARLESAIYFQADWSFVPLGVDPATVPAEVPKLRLRLIGWAPGLSDWRDLENLFLGYHEPPDGGEPSETRGPDMWIFQPGENIDPECGKWETDLKFGERRGGGFDFTFEAYAPSERVSKYRLENGLKEFFGQPLPPEWEEPEWINEGDRLSFSGRIELKEILCSTPINSKQPFEWAKEQARRELAMEQIGPLTLIEADHPDAKYKHRDGISETGRLVIIEMPTGESGSTAETH